MWTDSTRARGSAGPIGKATASRAVDHLAELVRCVDTLVGGHQLPLEIVDSGLLAVEIVLDSLKLGFNLIEALERSAVG